MNVFALQQQHQIDDYEIDTFFGFASFEKYVGGSIVTQSFYRFSWKLNRLFTNGWACCCYMQSIFALNAQQQSQSTTEFGSTFRLLMALCKIVLGISVRHALLMTCNG